jgi:predicted dehydrogenase
VAQKGSSGLRLPDHVKKKLWLVGAGPMAREYAKVLKALEQDFEVIGRGNRSASEFTAATGLPVLRELPKYRPDAAIIAVGVADLAATAKAVAAKRMLIEKPAGLSLKDFSGLRSAFVAYNRRFYSSTLRARELIEADGGVSSFNFEFTEWSRSIADSAHPAEVKAKWVLANSSHVLDLAFFLGGEPAKMSAFQKGGLSWHPSASVFAGAGRTQAGALFSYQANWEAPGRWGVEVMTKRRRLVLRPLEKLFVQEHGSVDLKPEALDDQLDRDFKPGLYLQTEAFLLGSKALLTVAEHVKRLKIWKTIGAEL